MRLIRAVLRAVRFAGFLDGFDFVFELRVALFAGAGELTLVVVEALEVLGARKSGTAEFFDLRVAGVFLGDRHLALDVALAELREAREFLLEAGVDLAAVHGAGTELFCVIEAGELRAHLLHLALHRHFTAGLQFPLVFNQTARRHAFFFREVTVALVQQILSADFARQELVFLRKKVFPAALREAAFIFQQTKRKSVAARWHLAAELGEVFEAGVGGFGFGFEGVERALTFSRELTRMLTQARHHAAFARLDVTAEFLLVLGAVVGVDIEREEKGEQNEFHGDLRNNKSPTYGWGRE